MESDLYTRLFFLSPLQVSGSRPVILYAEVKLSGSPVMAARVTAVLTAVQHSGAMAEPMRIQLLDNGNGGEEKEICGQHFPTGWKSKENNLPPPPT